MMLTLMMAKYQYEKFMMPPELCLQRLVHMRMILETMREAFAYNVCKESVKKGNMFQNLGLKDMDREIGCTKR